MDLTESRKIISDIDGQIVPLFVKRMEAAAEVAAYKKKAGLPVLDRSREALVLDRVAALAGEDFGGYARALYECVMALSRDYQQKLLEADET
ncbi:MAG: chorismate mutase [Clostridia bacterium]|nr:chorismate mutase [Clostridia bacterium]